MGGFRALPQGAASAGVSGLSPAPTSLPFILADQVATQFKMSLLQLVEILKSKEPAYVRCIKPNDAKQPGKPSAPWTSAGCASPAEATAIWRQKPSDHPVIPPPGRFDEVLIRHQVKYLGLMENLRVRRAGFAYRRKYEAFLQRWGGAWLSARGKGWAGRRRLLDPGREDSDSPPHSGTGL